MKKYIKILIALLIILSSLFFPLQARVQDDAGIDSGDIEEILEESTFDGEKREDYPEDGMAEEHAPRPVQKKIEAVQKKVDNFNVDLDNILEKLKNRKR